MEIKYLISLDLDGTLLDDSKNISESTKSYLRYLENKGHYIVLCSGRSPYSILNYYKDIGLKSSPYIGFNGNTIRKVKNKDILFNAKIKYKYVKKLYSLIKDKYIYCSFAQGDKYMFFDKDKDFVNIFFNDKNLILKEGNLDSIINEDLYTFVIKFKDLTLINKEYIKKLVRKRNKKIELRFWWKSDCGELHLKKVSKASSLKKLARYLKIKKNNVLVFGDADNDLELFKTFKNSYLMKNGNQDLAPFAKNITKETNNNDGVKLELESFFKEETS